jgi:hypothetical protein
MILSIYQSAPDFATIHSISVFEDDCVVVFLFVYASNLFKDVYERN